MKKLKNGNHMKIKYSFFFDYIYYRVNAFYFKWDGRNGITSVISVSMIQFLILFNLSSSIIRFFYTRKQTAPFSKSIGYVGVAIFIVLMLINYLKYYNSYNRFKTYWKNELPEVRKKKGWMVLAVMILPWVYLIIMGLIK